MNYSVVSDNEDVRERVSLLTEYLHNDTAHSNHHNQQVSILIIDHQILSEGVMNGRIVKVGSHT